MLTKNGVNMAHKSIRDITPKEFKDVQEKFNILISKGKIKNVNDLDDYILKFNFKYPFIILGNSRRQELINMLYKNNRK